jgi:hypothetical protein
VEVVIEDDENEVRAQRVIEAVENGQEPRELALEEERPPRPAYLKRPPPLKIPRPFPKKRSVP